MIVLTTSNVRLGRLGDDVAPGFEDPTLVGFPGYVDYSGYTDGGGSGSAYDSIPTYDTPNPVQVYAGDGTPANDSGSEVSGPIYSSDEGIPTFSSTTTELGTPTPNTTPISAPVSSGGGNSLFDDLAAFLGGNSIVSSAPSVTPIVSKVATSVPSPTKPASSKPAMPTVSPKQPPKASGNKPNVDAYEALLKANLAAYLASSMTSQDQLVGENYFTQEWTLFSNEMAQAGSWGTQGVKDRSRGGKFDWWHAYYDPITTSQTTSTGSVGGSLSNLLGGASGSPNYLVIGLVAFVAIWGIFKLTE